MDTPALSTSRTTADRYEISFPSLNGGLDQDAECCDVVLDGETRRIRFHDYDEIYAIPGLYEQLFYDELRCQSPRVVVGQLTARLAREGVDPASLRVLDLGAGNGMVGEELAAMGAGTLVGVDILRQAADATERDRPDVYSDYVVTDLTALPDEDRVRLEGFRCNALTTVAALGFGDVPVRAFAQAFNLVEDGGWLAFSIKQDFLDDQDGSGFAGFIRSIAQGGGRFSRRAALEILDQQPYQHRLAAAGDALTYTAVVARKRSSVPLPD